MNHTIFMLFLKQHGSAIGIILNLQPPGKWIMCKTCSVIRNTHHFIVQHIVINWYSAIPPSCMFVVQSSETVIAHRSTITGQLLNTTTDKFESTYQSQTTVCLLYKTILHVFNLHLFALRRSTCLSVAVEIVVKSCQQNS